MRGLGTGLTQMLEPGLELGDDLVDTVDLEIDDGQVLVIDARFVEDAADRLEDRLHEPLDVDDLVLDALLRPLPIADLALGRLQPLAVLAPDALDGLVEDPDLGLGLPEPAVEPVALLLQARRFLAQGGDETNERRLFLPISAQTDGPVGLGGPGRGLEQADLLLDGGELGFGTFDFAEGRFEGLAE